MADLIQRIKDSADKLEADRTTRGDLKILSRALRELRYAFKVFAPYRRCRKVTVFGSARTQPDAPSYQQAVAFGGAMAFALIFNAMSVNIAERTREVATLLAVGTDRRSISRYITAENLLVAAMGTELGRGGNGILTVRTGR